MSRRELVDIALGTERADFVLKHTNLVNVSSGEIYETDIAIAHGLVVGLGDYNGRKELDATNTYAVPGLIDGHTHIEMSMLSVREFAKAVVPRGTTAVVEDPHEIANVLGLAGIRAMLTEARRTPLKVYCMAPSCVPATEPSRGLESSGAQLGAEELEELFTTGCVIGLAEVMDHHGVLTKGERVWKKIELAEAFKATIDGHAPLLSGKALNAYVLSGMGSDHESVSYEEAHEKLRLGMRVMVREGSAARNLHAIAPLLNGPETRNCMLVTDGDRTPRELRAEGYMDHLVRRAIEEGIDPVRAVQLCTINPAQWFKLDEWLGSISPGKCADIVLLTNLERFEVKSVLVNGTTEWACPAEAELEYPQFGSSVRIKRTRPEDFAVLLIGTRRARIIGLRPSELLTEELIEEIRGIEIARDILKVAVVERHHCSGSIGVGFVKGFGLKKGAVASSIAHDSHNIVVIGTNDVDMAFACNRLKELGGGIVLCAGSNVVSELALPIAGLMSDCGLEEVARRQADLDEQIRALGCTLQAPFITLSFLALPVIPELRITDKGLVDVENQKLVDIFCD